MNEHMAKKASTEGANSCQDKKDLKESERWAFLIGLPQSPKGVKAHRCYHPIGKGRDRFPYLESSKEETGLNDFSRIRMHGISPKLLNRTRISMAF